MTNDAPMGNIKSKVRLTGSKTRGWVIDIADNYHYSESVPITNEEAVMLRDLLVKKLK